MHIAIARVPVFNDKQIIFNLNDVCNDQAPSKHTYRSLNFLFLIPNSHSTISAVSINLYSYSDLCQIRFSGMVKNDWPVVEFVLVQDIWGCSFRSHCTLHTSVHAIILYLTGVANVLAYTRVSTTRQDIDQQVGHWKCKSLPSCTDK